jgi:hypothetical protein
MADINAKQPVLNDGIYDVSENPVPSSAGLISSSRSASIDETTMDQRITATPGDNDKIAMDVAISDSDGNKIDESNPLAVYNAESPGTEVDDYDEAVDIAKDASSNHDYTVSSSVSFKGLEVFFSGSGLMKGELQIETAPAAGTFTTVAVGFNSVSTPNSVLTYKKAVPADVIVRLVKTNLDNQAQSLYSQIKGLEI